MANKALTDYQEYLATATKRSFARAERFEVHFNILPITKFFSKL